MIGTQIVSVPSASIEGNDKNALGTLLAPLIAVFVALLLALNAVLYVLIFGPVRRIAQIADRLSVGDSNAPEFPASGDAEIASLGRSFNRLRISLDKALQLLENRT